MLDLDKIILEIKKLINNKNKNLISSAVLFGSYARGDYKDNSDVDILLVYDEVKGFNEKLLKFENEILKITDKIELLIISKKEFKEKVLSFNHQLITLFYDAKVIFDEDKFYYKMENLFLALCRKEEFTLRVRRKLIKLSDLRKLKSYY